ncbi:hypothetical protein DID96_18670 [Burkholderia sp. Bp8963]|nr:hypothetical protein DID96_18670 [Burkholderia sp. Bp8963]
MAWGKAVVMASRGIASPVESPVASAVACRSHPGVASARRFTHTKTSREAARDARSRRDGVHETITRNGAADRAACTGTLHCRTLAAATGAIGGQPEDAAGMRSKRAGAARAVRLPRVARVAARVRAQAVV